MQLFKERYHEIIQIEMVVNHCPAHMISRRTCNKEQRCGRKTEKASPDQTDTVQKIQTVSTESCQISVDSWHRNLSQMCLKWPLVFGFHFPAQYANNHVNHFHFLEARLQSAFTAHNIQQAVKFIPPKVSPKLNVSLRRCRCSNTCI